MKKSKAMTRFGPRPSKAVVNSRELSRTALEGRRTTGFSLLLLALFLCITAGEHAHAGTGSQLVLPGPGVKNRSGLLLHIDPRWVSGSGYRPVRIRIAQQPFGPATADRSLKVHLRPRGWSGGNAGGVTGTVEIKQGDTFGEAIIAIPQTNIWNSMEIATTEDGWKLRDLSMKNMGMLARHFSTAPDTVPSIVVVHWAADDRTRGLVGGATTAFEAPNGKISSLHVEASPVVMPGGFAMVPWLSLRDRPLWAYELSKWIGSGGMGMIGSASTEINFECLPDIRVLAGRFPEAYVNSYGVNGLDAFSTKTAATDSAISRLVDDMPNLDLLPPNLLPDRWLDYTNIDVLLISRVELQGLKDQFPEKWLALRTWLFAGATLCVYDVGEEFEHRGEIEQLMQLDPVSADDQPDLAGGWHEPSVKGFTNTIDATKSINGGVTWWQQQQMIQGSTKVTSPPSPPKKSPFVVRRAGQGHLVAIATETPFPGTDYGWNWIFNSIPSRNWLPYQRHGVSHYQENMQFWNFLVEGIGRAPVKTFLAMITLFAIVIGPVNYFALHRRGRLYLLLVTVPIGAMLVSGGLFLFAMVGDGLGTRVRLRSYTELDQNEKKSLSWSRQTYYAGFAPSRGLLFPTEAAIYPVEHRPTSYSGIENTRRELAWTDQQNLMAGYFSSRTMSQFVVVEPQSTAASVQVAESSGSPPEVTNAFGVEIDGLVLRDSQGELFEVDKLAAGQTMTATKIDEGDVAAKWRNRYRATRPAYPEAFDQQGLDDVTQFFSSRSWRFPSNLAPPVFETSVMETGIREALDKDFQMLSRRSFVAILSRSPFVSIGVESVSHESGFHVVVGRW
jgi:hypothetical protein